MQLHSVTRKQIGTLKDNENITKEFDSLIRQINKNNDLIEKYTQEMEIYMRWHHGKGLPSKNLGVDGEFYLDEITKNIYKKVNGNWL